MAGTPGDKLSADYIYGEWKSQGLDSIQMIDYDVFLSFPDDKTFNKYLMEVKIKTQNKT
jgi:hypothetical protein